MEKNRLEAFSDGVFAIVITLLILEVRIPDVDYRQLPAALYAIAPRIIAYVMSFVVIGIYWVSHHQSLQLIHKTDRPFLWLNVLLLLFVSFMPFPTMLLGRYPLKALPIMIYGLNLIAANATGFIMLLYLKYHKNLSNHADIDQMIKRQIPAYIGINSAYALAIVMGCFFPVISYMIYLLILIVVIGFMGKHSAVKK